jgi:group II intron reverse transcriptase/maturase
MAVEHIKKLEAQGYKVVLDADISGFFDNIPHHMIMRMLAEKVADGNILSIVEKFLEAGVVEDGQLKPTERGTPQGGNISPLIANVVLNRLDWTLADEGFMHIRYADDFVVLCRECTHAEKALDLVKQVLGNLELSLSEKKTRIATFYEGFDFLGFHISCHRASIRTKSIENFKTKVRKLTRRSHNLNIFVINSLNNLIRGSLAYFNPWFGTPWAQFRKLDFFIRQRIRAMKFKRKWMTDNYRLRNKHIRKMGLLFFMDFHKTS